MSEKRIHVKQHLPGFVTGFEPVEADVDSVEAIKDIEFVQRWKPAEGLCVSDSYGFPAFLMHEGWVVALITGASSEELLRVFPKADMEAFHRKHEESLRREREARMQTFEYQRALYRNGDETLDFDAITALALGKFGTIDTIVGMHNDALVEHLRVEEELKKNPDQALALKARRDVIDKDVDFFKAIIDAHTLSTRKQS